MIFCCCVPLARSCVGRGARKVTKNQTKSVIKYLFLCGYNSWIKCLILNHLVSEPFRLRCCSWERQILMRVGSFTPLLLFAEAFLHSTKFWTAAASCCCVLYNLCLFEKQTVYHMPRLNVDFSQDSMSRKWDHFARIRHSFAMIQCSDDFRGLTIAGLN